MSLTASLLTAVSALNAAQAQLQLVSGNIANVNTPGYSRKTAALNNQVVAGRSSGVQVSDVTRTVNESLVRQLRAHIAKLGGVRITEEFQSRTQGFFGTLDSNTAISNRVADLGSAFDALAATPDSPVTRSATVQAAMRLSEQLNAITENLQQMRLDADRAIGQSVARINGLLSDIGNLNEQIALDLGRGQPVADRQDQRDALIGQLAEEVDLQYFERSTGEVVLMTTSGRILLDSLPTTLSHSPAAQVSASATRASGLSGVLYGGAAIDISDELGDGTLKGLLDVRDRTLVDLQAQIDLLGESLRNQINALHNDGTAYPPPTTLTGARSVAATDQPAMTGSFRIAAVDSSGIAVETLDIDLTTLAPPTIGQLVTQISAMANVSASINANGQVVVSATGSNRIAVNELDSAVNTGNATIGMAHFLGLNNFFDSAIDYDRYFSDRVANDTTALGLAGTLTFQIGAAAPTVTYGAGDSLTAIAANINADATISGANITASVVREGDGYRLQVVDDDGDNVFVTDSGPLVSQLNLRAGFPGTSGRLAVATALAQNPDLVARGELSDAAGLAVGDLAITDGDGSVATRIGTAFTTDIAFTAAGGAAAITGTLEGYATAIVARNAADTANARADLELSEGFQAALDNQVSATSGVNLDEELAQIVVLQNTYAASARITSVVSQLLDELLEAVR